VFRDPCHASTYDLDGTCVYGFCARDLDQVPVIVRGDKLFLDISPQHVIKGSPTSWIIRPPPYNQPPE
jgi:Rieske Fe-S protein